MNILLINYEYPPVGGGAATATKHIAKALSGQGHSVTVLTSQFKRHSWIEYEDKVRLVRCPAIRKKAFRSNIFEMFTFILSAFLLVPFVARKYRIQGTIVFFSFPCGPLGLWLKMISGIPYVVSLRGGDVPGTEPSLDNLHKFLKPLRHMVFRHSRAVVANSRGLADLSEKADPFKVRVIPNGVDIDFFKPAEMKRQGIFRFLFAGRFQSQKNLFFLLEQVSNLAKEADKKFELHMVGDGPQCDDLKKYAEELGISDRIIWHGWVNKEMLRLIYQEADCFLNPSLYEGLPNTVLEAMACGLPVIASRVAGNEELVENGYNGWLVDVESFVCDLPGRMIQIMEEGSYQLFSNRFSRIAAGQYSWEITSSSFMKLFIERG